MFVWIKQRRDDLRLWRYLKKRPPELACFLSEHAELAGGAVLVSIAFERPSLIEWQLRMARLHVKGATLIVLDNSRSQDARDAISAMCRQYGVPYLALPKNTSRHVNRSHGMAMSWAYYNVICSLRPSMFGFIDHDLIPAAPLNVPGRLAGQAVYGMSWGDATEAWQLWAGYCLFAMPAVQDKSLNFLHDFPHRLDTGGRNWQPLYRRLDRGVLRFAKREFVQVHLSGTAQPSTIEVVDDAWIHIGGIGYNDNFSRKADLCARLDSALSAGQTLASLRHSA